MFGITFYFNFSTWVLTTIIGTSTNFVGKGKVQETMVSSALLIDSSFYVVMTTCSFWEFIVAIVACISKFFWETIPSTSTNLPSNQSYI